MTAYWAAAQVTRGELPGVYAGAPKDVLIAATQDSWEHTIVPRLIAAAADLTNTGHPQQLAVPLVPRLSAGQGAC